MEEERIFYVKGNRIMERIKRREERDVTAIFPSICRNAMTEEERAEAEIRQNEELINLKPSKYGYTLQPNNYNIIREVC